MSETSSPLNLIFKLIHQTIDELIVLPNRLIKLRYLGFVFLAIHNRQRLIKPSTVSILSESEVLNHLR